MTPNELSYMERMIYRQTLITDLVFQEVLMEEILKLNPTTEQLEELLTGIIKLKIKYPERFNQ